MQEIEGVEGGIWRWVWGEELAEKRYWHSLLCGPSMVPDGLKE